MLTNRLLALAAACAGLALPALSQGQDQCAMAQPIMGTGTFAFDSSAATIDGVDDPLCYAFGTSAIDNDVWFDWTPPNDGTYILDTCTQTTVDTKVGILDGGCAGVVIACNDDSCGLQSSVSYNALAASTYLVRMGTFPGGAGGTGTFTIVEDAPVLNPANGHYYQSMAMPGITWQDAKLLAESMTYQGQQGYLATLTDQAENDFVFGLPGSQNNHWVGGFQDLDDPNYMEPGGGWKWITGEPWSYTNWLPGEPNDTGAFPSEDFLELLDSTTFGQTWNDVHPMEHPGGLVIEFGGGGSPGFCFGDGGGTACPCGNEGGAGEGCANSSGSGAQMSSGGSASVAADDLTFATVNMLPNQPALLFSGENALNNGNGVPFGDGLRCAGNNVKRLGVMVPDAGGNASWGPGLAPAGGWGAGDTRRFQTWYRDPNGSPCGFLFNLSQGLEVVFVP